MDELNLSKQQIKESDLPKICYLLDSKKPLKIGEGFCLPIPYLCSYMINSKGRVTNFLGGDLEDETEINALLDCINGTSHIGRMSDVNENSKNKQNPQCPNLTGSEIEILEWYHDNLNADTFMRNYEYTVLFYQYNVGYIGEISMDLFPSLKKYPKDKIFDIVDCLKWNGENSK